MSRCPNQAQAELTQTSFCSSSLGAVTGPIVAVCVQCRGCQCGSCCSGTDRLPGASVKLNILNWLDRAGTLALPRVCLDLVWSIQMGPPKDLVLVYTELTRSHCIIREKEM